MPTRDLLGRDSECSALDQLVASVRAGPSRALVLRGEAGVGKSALLAYLVQRASGCEVVRAAGVESEMELAFAGLQQLCAPFVDRLERLPGPQRGRARHGVRPARGRRAGSVPGRAGGPEPAVRRGGGPAAGLRRGRCAVARCGVDAGAHVRGAPPGRRIGGLVLGVRESAGERPFDGLPELVVGGLDDGDARALLEAVVAGPLDERVRDRIVAETRGNPLALLELPRGRTPAELAGGFGLNGGPGAVRPHRGALPAAAGGAAAGDAAVAPGRRVRAGRRCPPAVEGGRRAGDRRRRRSPGRRRGADRARWPGALPPSAGAIRGVWRGRSGGPPARPPRPRRGHRPRRSIPIAGRGTARRPRPGSTRTSPTSWSTRPRARGRAAAWPRARPSMSAPPS